MSTSRLEIDLAAIDHNIATLRSCANIGAKRAHASDQSLKLCAVIKQDAYGLGSPRIAKRLASAGVDMLAVYCPAEARALADLPIKCPILVLMPMTGFDRNDALYRLAVRDRLHLTIHSLSHLEHVMDLSARLGMTIPVHVQVDTGLARGGCLPEEAAQIVRLVTANPGRTRLAGLMTHFSSPQADESFTKEQARLFRAWVDAIKPMLAQNAKRQRSEEIIGVTANSPTNWPVMVHAANTAAALRSHSLHGTMLRVGQGLFGFGGSGWSEDDGGLPEFAPQAKNLKPVVRWLSRIIHTHAIPAGWPVGYDRTFVTSRPSRIAVVPVGYADGYPRTLSNRGVVRLTGLAWDRPRTIGALQEKPESGLQGYYARVVGRVSMDQITIDVTDLPENISTINCEVEIIGTDVESPTHLPIVATLAETISHDLLCRLSPSLERTYLASADLTDQLIDTPEKLPHLPQHPSNIITSPQAQLAPIARAGA